jgi:AraC family transcriptional regulator
MDERVRRVIDFLEAHRFRAPALGRLANAAGLSPSHLQHLFKRDVGVSIRAFVKTSRLRLAAELIARTDRRISEVLYDVGFSDFSNFDHAFKREFGATPREYRNAAEAKGSD